MEAVTKEPGGMTCNMEQELRSGRTEVGIKAATIAVKSTDTEDTFGPIEANMPEIGRAMRWLATAGWCGPMADDMTDNGSTTRSMESENTSGRMEDATKVNTAWMLGTATANWFFLTVLRT